MPISQKDLTVIQFLGQVQMTVKNVSNVSMLWLSYQVHDSFYVSPKGDSAGAEQRGKYDQYNAYLDKLEQDRQERAAGLVPQQRGDYAIVWRNIHVNVEIHISIATVILYPFFPCHTEAVNVL